MVFVTYGWLLYNSSNHVEYKPWSKYFAVMYQWAYFVWAMWIVAKSGWLRPKNQNKWFMQPWMATLQFKQPCGIWTTVKNLVVVSVGYFVWAIWIVAKSGLHRPKNQKKMVFAVYTLICMSQKLTSAFHLHTQLQSTKKCPLGFVVKLISWSPR